MLVGQDSLEGYLPVFGGRHKTPPRTQALPLVELKRASVPSAVFWPG